MQLLPVEQTNPPTMAVLIGGLLTLPLRQADTNRDRLDHIVATASDHTISVSVLSAYDERRPSLQPGTMAVARVRVKYLATSVSQGDITRPNAWGEFPD